MRQHPQSPHIKLPLCGAACMPNNGHEITWTTACPLAWSTTIRDAPPGSADSDVTYAPSGNACVWTRARLGSSRTLRVPFPRGQTTRCAQGTAGDGGTTARLRCAPVDERPSMYP